MRLAVIDLVVREGLLVAAASLPLGVVPLAERFPFPHPVEWRRYGDLALDVRQRLARELPVAIRATQVERLVGTAGTVTTLAALDLGLETYDAGRIQGHVLERRAIEGLRRRLGDLSEADRARLPCLEPGRADLVIAGIAIVLELMAWTQCESLLVSDSGLREGVVTELAGKLAP